MLMVYIILSIVLILCYLVTVGCYVFYWRLLKKWAIPTDWKPKTFATIIVAARNEEANIGACLEAILQQQYPRHLLEIYVVNDHSEDATAAIVQSYQQDHRHLNLLSMPTGVEGKKKAIEQAIKHSKGSLIVTTDADCTMGKDWLNYIISCYEKSQAKFIAAPVSFYREKSWFEYFQTLDFMGMMAVAGAGVRGQFMNMCNGANLAYERAAFEAVNGFEGIGHVASGDDMLLMQKIASQYPNQIAYVKNIESQTFTYAKPTVKSFVQQRVRWTSKSGAYTGWQVLAMLATVWLLCLTMLVDVVLIPLDVVFVYLFLAKFILKGIADFIFLGMMARFFERTAVMRYFIPALFMHWWYIAFVGTLGNLVKRYEWKGRTVK